MRDGDHIYAVLKGGAINNDGNLKAGYTAPSIEGQISVAKQAFDNAQVHPDTISFVEAHGTATALGILSSSLRSARRSVNLPTENNIAGWVR